MSGDLVIRTRPLMGGDPCLDDPDDDLGMCRLWDEECGQCAIEQLPEVIADVVRVFDGKGESL